MPKYTVKTPVNHDDQRYEIGDPIELDIKTAKPLLDVKAIEKAAAEPKAPTEPKKPTEPKGSGDKDTAK